MIGCKILMIRETRELVPSNTMDITVLSRELGKFQVNWAELELAEWFIDSNPCPLYPLFSLLCHAHAYTHGYTHTRCTLPGVTVGLRSN